DTTPQDARAVAWLLERGANTSIVSDYLYHALTDEQRRLFNDLVGSLQPLREKGMRILLATAHTDHYVGELAIVVHRLMDLERADALFCVVRMRNRTYVVGRSRENGPDVAQILRHLGGGGHPHAASAAMREGAVEEVCETLRHLLRD